MRTRRRRRRRRPRRPRKTIRRGDRNVVFHVTPGAPGNATFIVLDAGGGLDSSYWNDFVPTLSQRTGATIVTYDRAGMGQSDEAPGPWNLEEATTDLEHGLRQLHATQNVILVSHSLAGEIATNLVNRHPQWFTGSVLVDANVPDVYTEDFIARAQAIYAPVLAQIRTAPPSVQGRQLLALSESFVETSRAFHRMEWPNAVPVTVIVAERPPFESEVDANGGGMRMHNLPAAPRTGLLSSPIAVRTMWSMIVPT